MEVKGRNKIKGYGRVRRVRRKWGEKGKEESRVKEDGSGEVYKPKIVQFMRNNLGNNILF